MFCVFFFLFWLWNQIPNKLTTKQSKRMVIVHGRVNISLENIEIIGYFFSLRTFPLCKRVIISAWDSPNMSMSSALKEFLESDCVNIFNSDSCWSCYFCKFQSSRNRSDSKKWIRKISIGALPSHGLAKSERHFQIPQEYVSHNAYLNESLNFKETLMTVWRFDHHLFDLLFSLPHTVPGTQQAPHSSCPGLKSKCCPI